MLSCGFPASVPAHSVIQACISSNQAITSGIKFNNFYGTNSIFLSVVIYIQLILCFFVIEILRI